MRRSIPDHAPRKRDACRSIACTRCTGRNAATATACRCCSFTAGRAAAACRIIAASTIHAFWRIVLYDQRGAGRSTPLGGARPTTRPRTSSPTSSGCASICGIERWLLFGGSWGSTLALLYARGASRARAWGSCCAASSSRRTREIDWFMHGMSRVFPEAVARFTQFLPPDGARRRARQLLSPPDRCRSARFIGLRRKRGTATRARARRCCPSRTATAASKAKRGALAIARIEAHYFMHDAFIEPNRILANIRASAICPARSCRAATTSSVRRAAADALARAWPDAEYIVVPDAGHSVREPGTTRELVAAVQRMQDVRSESHVRTR